MVKNIDEIKNRGTGAGGANTNINGKAYEKKVSHTDRLLEDGYVKKLTPFKRYLDKIEDFSVYYEKQLGPTTSVIYTKQNDFLYWLNYKHQANFNVKEGKRPDGAYIFYEGSEMTHVYIIEAKTQNVDGSVKEKVESADFKLFHYKQRFEKLTAKPKIHYAFSLDNYLKEWYQGSCCDDLRQYNQDHNIAVFFGEDPDYWFKLNKWIYS